jgi:hypothetical protein
MNEWVCCLVNRAILCKRWWEQGSFVICSIFGTDLSWNVEPILMNVRMDVWRYFCYRLYEVIWSTYTLHISTFMYQLWGKCFHLMLAFFKTFVKKSEWCHLYYFLNLNLTRNNNSLLFWTAHKRWYVSLRLRCPVISCINYDTNFFSFLEPEINK